MFSITVVTVIMLIIVMTIPHTLAKTIPGAFIIEYAEDNTSDSIIQQHNRLLSTLGPLSQSLDVRQTYSSPLFRGVSVNLDNYNSPSSPSFSAMKTVANNSYNNEIEDPHHPVLKQLIRNPSVINIYPIMEVPRPQWIVEENQVRMPYENTLSQLNNIHQELNITGSGITVGILDSGIDYEHPALGGGFGEGFRVRLGYNLIDSNKDDKEAGTHRGPNDPYDVCLGDVGGHGTHVSGIIAGVDQSKNFLGVAPDVTLGMWRVFGCTGGASEDVIIKAMEMAYAAGCNVINLSLGTQDAWPESPMSVVANRLAENGVVVVSVAGNQGGEGVYLQNSPGAGSKVISVASVDNSFYLTLAVTTDESPDNYYPYAMSSTTKQMPNGTITVLFDEQRPELVTTACPNAIRANLSTLASLNGTTLLVRRGDCPFSEKFVFAERLGAQALLIYDEDDKNPDHAILALTPGITIPAAGTSKEFAHQLIAIAKKKQEIETSMPTIAPSIKIYFSTRQLSRPLLSEGQVSSFSSLGPTYELDLKPTLAGIGGQVYSTLPRRMTGGWGTRSGTSMASPHVTGVVALMLAYYMQKNIPVDPLFITEQLQNHAQYVIFEEKPEHPLLQGAGLVQPFTSLQSEIHVSPGYISFNDTANFVKTHQLNITNRGQEVLTAEIQHIPSKAVLSYENITTRVVSEPHHRDDTQIKLEFTTSKITLQPGQSVDIQVTAQLPSMDYNYQMYGGFIQFVQKEDGYNNKEKKNVNDNLLVKTVSVPYFGVLGDLDELPLFDKGFPYLAPAGNSSIMYGSNDIFTLNTTEAQYPDIICRLLSPTSQITIQVLDQSNNIVGDIDGGPFKYWERNRLSKDQYSRSIQWNGKVATSATNSKESVMIPFGTYRLRVRALKMFGNPNILEQWEEWTSGPILVQQ
ncbi:peptidase S8/S53 domain-containing protein [Circinella umbellata]|nr:peptidase S8/S53 domain-containing protein [Circinella umbellata]